MPDKKNRLKVLDCTTKDNKYLHKDFHGALCYAIKYLDDLYGPEATTEYLRQVGNTYFLPLTEQLKQQGLSALKDHWQNIFSQETGQFTLEYEDNVLILKVTQCPAIKHLKKNNQFFTERFCETTKVVNETICSNAGYSCSCGYESGQGKCVQKFWKSKG